MQHAENAHGVTDDAKRDDMGRAGDDQLACAFDAARAITPWKPAKQLDPITDPRADGTTARGLSASMVSKSALQSACAHRDHSSLRRRQTAQKRLGSYPFGQIGLVEAE